VLQVTRYKLQEYFLGKCLNSWAPAAFGANHFWRRWKLSQRNGCQRNKVIWFNKTLTSCKIIIILILSYVLITGIEVSIKFADAIKIQHKINTFILPVYKQLFCTYSFAKKYLQVIKPTFYKELIYIKNCAAFLYLKCFLRKNIGEKVACKMLVNLSLLLSVFINVLHSHFFVQNFRAKNYKAVF